MLILNNLKETDAFGQNVGVTKVKGYLVFILAFTAITNSVVCTSVYHSDSRPLTNVAEICWFDVVSFGAAHYWMNVYEFHVLL